MTDPKKPLKCSSCGEQATGEMAKIAKVGETHYRRLQHGVGIPGRKRGGNIARSCGTWQEQVLEELEGARGTPKDPRG